MEPPILGFSPISMRILEISVRKFSEKDSTEKKARVLKKFFFQKAALVLIDPRIRADPKLSNTSSHNVRTRKGRQRTR